MKKAKENLLPNIVLENCSFILSLSFDNNDLILSEKNNPIDLY